MKPTLTTIAWLAGITVLVTAILAFAGLCTCAPMCVAAVVCAVAVGVRGLVEFARREVVELASGYSGSGSGTFRVDGEQARWRG